MDALLDFLQRHWLSAALIIGALVAIAYVYKNRKQFMI